VPTLDIESFEELKLLTDALLAARPEPAEDEDGEEFLTEELDPLLDKILAQAESGGVAPYQLELDEEEADRVAEALEGVLDAAAETGDVFQTGEIEGLLRRLGRG
jgi:hypothetical protein